MKIALAYNEILPAHRYGGVERVVMALAKWYRELGHQVFILAKTGSHLADYEHGFYPAEGPTGDLAHLVPNDIDFIHSHQPESVKPSKPFLISVHGNASPNEHFFPNTNFVSESHARNHKAKYFVYQGIEIDQFPLQKQKQDYYVFMAKAKWRVKNLRTAIAFANDVKAPLKIIGGVGRKNGFVEYMGFLGDDEGRLEILAHARGLLYPTNWDEPCALAPLEAMACGTPVIASRNGSMPEEVHSGTGFLCESYDEFVAAHYKIPQISPEFCRQNVEKHFSARRMAKDYLKLIQKILEQGELDHAPRAQHSPSSIHYLFKPTLWNRTLYSIRGKI